MNIELFPINEDVSVNCKIGAVSNIATGTKFGYFQIKGIYKVGSKGNPDGVHILGMMAYANQIFEYEKWVIDLSELTYQGGDKMYSVLDFKENYELEEVAIVYGTYCVKAMATLISENKSVSEFLAQKGNYLSIEEAYKFLTSENT